MVLRSLTTGLVEKSPVVAVAVPATVSAVSVVVVRLELLSSEFLILSYLPHQCSPLS